MRDEGNCRTGCGRVVGVTYLNSPAYICATCRDDWFDSIAYRTRAEKLDDDKFDRQLFDWIETRRLEKLNGGQK